MLNATFEGVTAIDCSAAVPCPLKLTVCGLLVASWVIVNVPLRVPVIVGVKLTLMVQFPFAARVAPHVVPACAKSPEAETPVIVRVVACALCTVTAWAALVVLVVCAAKVILAGVTVTGTAGAPVPVPDNVPVRTVGLVPTVAATVPVLLPFAVGRKLTLMVQDPFAASCVPQSFVWMKSPLVAMLGIASAFDWLFVRVKLLEAVVDPTFVVA